MAKFRKKAIVINAMRTPTEMFIQTSEGIMRAVPGDWIITGIKGEQYPCKNDIFRLSYEPVDSDGELLLNMNF